ncbi:MAG: translation initiation factor [Muribaculaceae bacterium]|nr:translation initiation factor [Muribaculaceae bacterium]
MDWKDALKNLAETLPPGEEPAAETPQAADKKPAATDRLVLTYEKKGRKGKPATIISGFTCNDDELKDIASKLKTSIAVGGSARGGEILLQGDCRTQAADTLRKLGYRL